MEQNQKPIFDYHEETHAEKLARKSKESPFMIIGLGALAASVGYGIYSYKNRGQMSTSVFLMKFRVIAQGATVAALTAGMAYTLYRNNFDKKEVISPNVLSKNEH
ncbi:unnamed protein product [Diatraea saccharalis]|uniref:HIG1 domain-containing protein n=1 Tax=Diatraea saccharalis TaxID=40085 RepID=A0A9N9N0P3_9NEOP|nr:unnamed protein product [Diatraea saccharalis]